MNAATTPVTIHGRHFRRGEDKFLIRGVVYQRNDAIRGPHGMQIHEHVLDPINDEHLPRLRHDVELFKELGVNTIFAYSIDNTKPRSQAMKLLADAGIYVLVSLCTPTTCIQRNRPYSSYHSGLMASYFRAIDAMAAFPNVLGAFVAYDLISNTHSLECTPVVAAVVRDLKRYMAIKKRSTGQRVLPIGYGVGDTSIGVDTTVMKYLLSQAPTDRIDFYAVRGSKCFPTVDKSGVDTSGLEKLYREHRDADLPIVISEYSETPLASPCRSFASLKYLFTPQMLDVFSGCCVYEMYNGGNQFGLVQMVGLGGQEKDEGVVTARRETEFGRLVIYEDFGNLKGAIEGVRDGVDGEDVEVGGGDEEGTVRIWEIEGSVPGSCVHWSSI